MAPRKKAVFIYFDETDLHWCPDKGKGYQLIGHQQEVMTPGTDEVKYIFLRRGISLWRRAIPHLRQETDNGSRKLARGCMDDVS